MKKQSKFIVFEGPHGSGKTTQAKLLKNYFDNQNIPAIYTKEPYLKDLKKIIEKYSFVNDEVSSHILLYLHAADRFAHTHVVKDKLEEGYNVISDRYLISSCVYQQIQGIPLECIEKVNYFCVEPDITFILDIPLQERKRRLDKNNRLRNTFFFKEEILKVEETLCRNIYQKYKDKWKNLFLISGKGNIDEIFKEVIDRLDTI